MLSRFKESFRHLSKEIKKRISIPKIVYTLGLLSIISIVGNMGLQAHERKVNEELLLQLTDPTVVEVVPCFGEQEDFIQERELPPQLPNNFDEEIEARRQEVENIQETQLTENQSEIQSGYRDTAEIFGVSQEYLNSITVNTYYSMPPIENEHKNKAYLESDIVAIDSSLYLSGGGIINSHGEPQPIWINLVDNHVIDIESINQKLKNNQPIDVIMNPINQNTGETSNQGMSGRVFNCQRIIVNGEHTGTLIAILGDPYTALEGGSTLYKVPDMEYKHQPYQNIDGGCDLNDEEDIKGVGFPGVNGLSRPNPYEFTVTAPFMPKVDIVVNDGEVHSFVAGQATAFGGLSGVPLEQNGRVCGLANYSYMDQPVIGFSTLPHKEEMDNIVSDFYSESWTLALNYIE